MEQVKTLAVFSTVMSIAIPLISIFIVIFFVVRLESINTYIRDIRNELRKMNNQK